MTYRKTLGFVPIPLPKPRIRGCDDGAHYMRAHLGVDGVKVWRCVRCPAERRFRAALFPNDDQRGA
jgi:hypothetical protein